MLSTIDLIFYSNCFYSIAGVFCAIVSHPADTVVSKLNQDKGSTAGQVVKKLGFAGKDSRV
jgi:solute carrier family 25 phosphate transporter 3